MNRFKFIVISILIVFGSCTEDDIITAPICIPSSEYYFSGIINAETVCINDEYENYQIYSGAGYGWERPAVGWYNLGFNTYPVEIGDKFFIIQTPKVEISDKETVLGLFPIGKLSDNEKEDFLMEYGKVIDVIDGHPVKEKLTGRFSEFEVLSIDEKSEDTFNIKLKFSCNLYDDKGNYQGEIDSAVTMLRLIFYIDF